MRFILLMLLSLSAAAAATAGAVSFEQLPDPTRPHAQRSESALPPASQGLAYTQVGPAGRVAVIDGRRVREGDRVSGGEVVAIGPFQVVLREGGRETVLRLMPELPREHK